MGSLPERIERKEVLASFDEIASEVAKLFAAFLYRPDQDMLRSTIAAYVERLAIFPVAVIERARKILVDRGGRFPPSAGEFRSACFDVADARSPKRPLAALPAPSPPSAAMAQAVRDLVRELVEKAESPEIRRTCGRKADSEDIRRAAEGRLAQLYDRRDEPLEIGPSLALYLREAAAATKTIEDC